MVKSSRELLVALGQFRKSIVTPQVGLPSFPNASIGNPGETRTGPPIKTFGGDAFRKIGSMFLTPRSTAESFISPQSSALITRHWLMSEMSHAGEDHGDTVLVGGGDYFFVLNGSARLNH